MTPRLAWSTAFACLAIAVPLSLPISTVPDAVFVNQLAALAGWGLWLLCERDAVAQANGRAAGMLQATLLFALLTVAAALGVSGPASAGVLLAAVAVLWAGRCATRDAVSAAALAWWIAGLACAAVALVQYFVPEWATGTPVAATTSAGRAVGNMRQPNHLATALLCAMVMTAWLCGSGRLRLQVALPSIAVMVLAVALSASRTGAVSLGVLVAWAVVDRRLPRGLRWVLASTPLMYLVSWGLVAAYAQLDAQQFYGAERLEAHGDISSSRFAIWRNALQLVALHPWAGVGWGNFNFAWTFTPFPDRPVAFFDHTHNVLLQLAVELGLPATAALLALLLWALWLARGALTAADDGPAAAPRAAAAHPGRAMAVMLVVLAVHSQLEYPLWYAYFVLPAAWALGVFLGSASPPGGLAGAMDRRPTRLFQVGGAVLCTGALYAAWDHHRIEEIFAPSAGAGSLESRIAAGQQSVLFGHHADYAAVTNDPKDTRPATFHRPLHQLVDVRLLIADIEALHANGHDAQALYAAQRLREFRRPDAQAYFADCTPDNPAPPFQCDQRPVPLTWRDMDVR